MYFSSFIFRSWFLWSMARVIFKGWVRKMFSLVLMIIHKISSCVKLRYFYWSCIWWSRSKVILILPILILKMKRQCNFSFFVYLFLFTFTTCLSWNCNLRRTISSPWLCLILRINCFNNFRSFIFMSYWRVIIFFWVTEINFLCRRIKC